MVNKVGDKIEKVTESVGIKSCKSCKERKETLNQFSRRGLLTGLATGVAAFALGARSLKAQSAVAHDEKAVKVLRFINTAQTWNFNETGKYLDLRDLLNSKTTQDIKSHPGSNKHFGQGLIDSLDINGSEIIPGWQLIHKADVDHYSATIKTVGNTAFTFTTNEEGLIETGTPITTRVGGVLGRILAFRCTGPFGEPGCCCQYVCCNLCHCCSGNFNQCFNCGCACCLWCEVSSCL